MPLELRRDGEKDPDMQSWGSSSGVDETASAHAQSQEGGVVG